MRRSRWPDRGVTVVEAAFALPIMLLFISGLVDLGMWTFNTNQATNAARDGARAGVLSYLQADVPGSPDHEAVVAAVQAHLPANTVERSEITVECLTATGTMVTCADARFDVDRIRVEVDWSWNLVTPVAPVIGVREGAARGSSSMAIVGLPVSGSSSTTTTTTAPTSTTTTTGAPGACAVEELTISPDPIGLTSHGASQLNEALKIEFTTTGSAPCGELTVKLVSSQNNPTTKITNVAPIEAGSPDYSWSYSGSGNIWKVGAGTVQILQGTTVLATDTFQVN